jgi:hypothetical protein
VTPARPCIGHFTAVACVFTGTVHMCRLEEMLACGLRTHQSGQADKALICRRSPCALTITKVNLGSLHIHTMAA